MSKHTWISELEKEIEEIEDLEPIDRLSSVAAVMKCITTVGRSVNGWIKWLKDPRLMKMFTEDQLDELLVHFKKYSIQMLNYDIEWTNKADKQFKKETSISKDSKHDYIS